MVSTEIGSKFCYEANISDNHENPEFRTGSIVRYAPPPEGAKIETIDQWNKMVIQVFNGKLLLAINGKITARITTEEHPKGYISLQRFKDGQIIFRNVKITEL